MTGPFLGDSRAYILDTGDKLCIETRSRKVNYAYFLKCGKWSDEVDKGYLWVREYHYETVDEALLTYFSYEQTT